MKSAHIGRAALAALLASTAAACNLDRTRPAIGNANSIIVATTDSLWAAIGDSVLAALEPRIFTVRDEKAFELTQISPTREEWRNLRQFRRVLAIGVAGDFWMEPVLEGRDAPALPALVERASVWARDQQVTAIVIPPGGGAAEVYRVLGTAADTIDTRYRNYTRMRMFTSGMDEALQDTLARTAGFSLLLPNIYRYTPIDSGYVFRNHSEMSGVLQRAILVAWRSGASAAPATEDVLALRDSVGDVAYDPRQNIDRSRVETRVLNAESGPILEVHGIWNSEDTSWPAAGPFITRVVPCPEQNRTYVLDAWLFAPGKSKYEYMLQLNAILDSFRCGRAALEAARQAAS